MEEIRAAFDMSSIDLIEALHMLDPVDIPKENPAEYGNEKLEILFDFYGKPLQDSYEDRTVASPALINCTQESLALEYKHCKEYVINQRNDLSAELLAKEKSVKRKLGWLKVDATKNKKNIKIAEEELLGIQNKQKEPLTMKELLNDSVVSFAFPTIRYLLKLFMLVPMSEAIVERGFSKMKLIMTIKRACLDDKSLNALMRISFKSKPLTQHQIKVIISEWKKQGFRCIFGESM